MHISQKNIFCSAFSDCSSDDDWSNITFVDDDQPSPQGGDYFFIEQEMAKLSQELLRGTQFSSGAITAFSSDDNRIVSHYDGHNNFVIYEGNTSHVLTWKEVQNTNVLTEYFDCLENINKEEGDEYFLNFYSFFFLGS